MGRHGEQAAAAGVRSPVQPCGLVLTADHGLADAIRRPGQQQQQALFARKSGYSFE